MKRRPDVIARQGLPKKAWAALLLCVAVVAATASCTLIPKVVNARIDREERALLSTDLAPRAPLRINGTLGIVIHRTGDAGEPGGSCEELCQHLLLNGGAQAVITASSLADTKARRWTVSNGQLPCALPASDRRWDTWPRFGYDHSELVVRSVAGSCLVSAPASLGDARDIIELNILGVETSRAQYTDWHPPLVGQQISLWRRDDAGRLALTGRATWRLPRKLTPWLHKEHNGSVNSPRIGWARLEAPGQAYPSEPAFALKNFIALDLQSPPAVSTDAVRRAIDAWLDTPGEAAPRVEEAIATTFYTILEAEHSQPDDLTRGLRMLKDCRVFAGLSQRLVSAFPDQVVPIRDTLVSRMQGVDLAENDRCIADRALADLPKGAFASLSPQIVALLQNAGNAPFLPGVTERVSEAGPSVAPLLFSLIEANTYATRAAYDEANSAAHDATGPDSRIAEAAIAGLCKIEHLPPADVARLRIIFAANPNLDMAIRSCRHRPRG